MSTRRTRYGTGRASDRVVSLRFTRLLAQAVLYQIAVWSSAFRRRAICFAFFRLKAELQTTMERIVFLERNTIEANFRRPDFEHEWVEYPETTADQVVDRARDATIIISNKLSLAEPQL